MINVRLFTTLSLLILLIHVAGADAAFWGDRDAAIDLRYGRHNDYQRVVIEGPHDFITTAQVKQKDTQVRVIFASQDFSLKDTKLPISYKRDKNVLVFEQDSTASIKLRNLSDPSRLVIDFYPGTSTSDQKKDSKTKFDVADGKPEVAGAASSKPEKKKSQSQPDKKEQRKRVLSKVKHESVKNEKTGDTDSALDIRYGRHNDYQRVVIEGPHDYITTAQVIQKDKQVTVTFASQDFSLKDTQLPISYRRDKNVLIFEQDTTSSVQHRNLSGPSRLVIDFYTAHESPGHKKDAKADVADGKTEVAGNEPTITEKKEQEQRAQSEVGESELNKKTEKNSVKPLHTAEAQASDKKEITKEKKNKDTDFVPEHYKKLWTLLETGNNYGLLTVLPEYKPKNAGSVAVYHYMYGAASFGAKQYLNAIDHLRLAYIYSTNRKLKEKALSLRAETYMTIKLYQEARADYMMLIETFPSSKKIRKAHLGLGDSLAKLGLYRKAVM
jgi:tetratricopeptide (TPR) repeat protein